MQVERAGPQLLERRTRRAADEAVLRRVRTRRLEARALVGESVDEDGHLR